MQASNIKIIWDRVLFKPIKPDDKTKGGIFIPEQAKEKPEIGIVVAVGNGRRDPKTGVLKPMQTKAGDKILYNPHDGEKVVLDGVEHLMINDFEVLAVIG